MSAAPFRVAIVHPCVGRRRNQRGYVRTWLMEPLPAATVAALLPAGCAVRFHDDRLEAIPYDEPADLVCISVETYTARRAYQIASEYRRRRVPVVMGGFHATLATAEVARFADSTVAGEAEALLPLVIDDWRHGRGRRIYRAEGRPDLAGVRPDRSIFRGKRYLPVSLIETARGCRFRCDFCAIQTAFGATQRRRPLDLVLAELRLHARPGRLTFLIDDNVVSDPAGAKELFRAMAPLGLTWVGQASSDIARDEEALALMRASGCIGVLIGFETLEAGDLRRMGKAFNLGGGGPSATVAAFRRHGIRVYGTFVVGCDGDTRQAVRDRVRFAIDSGMFIAAFNHLTPFPGTPLYHRLATEGRLRWPAWWLAADYRYNDVPFIPARMSPDEVRRTCLEARRSFYGWSSIARRAAMQRSGDPLMALRYWAINAMHRWDVDGRDGMPLGDEAYAGELIEAC